MKYFALITLFALSTAYAQEIKPNVLDDDFKLAPKLEKGNGADYEEKKIDQNNKLFKKNTDDKFNITKGKEHSDKMEIYQLKMEKKNGEIEKSEKLVEFDKNDLGKIKKLTKCRHVHHLSKKMVGCQSYSEPFCKELIKEKDWNGKIAKDGNAAALEFYKELYKQKDSFDLKSAELAKLKAMNEASRAEIGEEPKSAEIKGKLSPVYPSAAASFDIEKVKVDIAECDNVKNDWKIERVAGSDEAAATASSAQ